MKSTKGITTAAIPGIIVLLACFATVAIHVGTSLNDRFVPTPEKIERSVYNYSDVSTDVARPSPTNPSHNDALEYYVKNETLVGFRSDSDTNSNRRMDITLNVR